MGRERKNRKGDDDDEKETKMKSCVLTAEVVVRRTQIIGRGVG